MRPEDIKRLRTHLNWSQERLARELGVSFCTVNRWERGRTTPSRMAAKVLERLLETNPLLGKRSSPRSHIRYPISVERVYGAPGLEGGDAFTAYTENLSAGGLMFNPCFGVETGDRLRISIALGEGRSVSAISEVRWTEGDGGSKKAGVAFREIDPSALSAIAGVMRTF